MKQQDKRESDITARITTQSERQLQHTCKDIMLKYNEKLTFLAQLESHTTLDILYMVIFVYFFSRENALLTQQFVYCSVNSQGIIMLVDLTGPTGMPRAIRSSSDRSPGFFSFKRVSNSFPCTKSAHREGHLVGLLKQRAATAAREQ